MTASNEFKGKQGLTRLINAFGYSCAGLAAAWKHEAAFREEMLLTIIAIPLGLWLGHGGVEKALLIGSIILVPIAELVNSAIEAVVDRISNDHHELSGRAKDIGSAVVLLTLGLAGAVWALILIPHYL